MGDNFLQEVLNDPRKAQEPIPQSNAKAENKLTNQERLEEAEQNEHDRIEDWRAYFYKHFKILFSVLCGVFVLILSILLWHWLTPSCWHWLAATQLDNLKNIVLAVFASSAIGSWINKIK